MEEISPRREDWPTGKVGWLVLAPGAVPKDWSIDQVMINNETSRDRMQQCQRMEQRVGRMT